MSFLGNTVEEIAQTKMRSVDKKMLIGYQIHNSVYQTALKVKEQIKEERNKDIIIQKVEDFDKYPLNKKFARYLKRNLHLVIKCLEELNIPLHLEYFDDVELFGRCQKIAKNITIDVGHNPLAARVLKEEFKNKKITLIYNSYADKDYEKVLSILKPIINKIIIINVDDKRIVPKNNLVKIIDKLNIIKEDIITINDNEEYLVFGSFLVVENFLYLIGTNKK